MEVEELEVIDVIDEVSRVLEEILELEDKSVDFFLYKLSLLPAPQYSVVFPAQIILHCVAAVRADPIPSVFPHQHSLLSKKGQKINYQSVGKVKDPYSTPAYRYILQIVRHLLMSISLAALRTESALPVVASV